MMFVAPLGCDRNQSEDTPAVPKVERKTAELLVFDPALRVPDDSVNDFVDRAMRTATSGDYGQFRLLWATREEPMPKAQFEEGWQAVQQIRIRALEPALVELPRSTGTDHPYEADDNPHAVRPAGEAASKSVDEADEVVRGDQPVEAKQPGTTPGQPTSVAGQTDESQPPVQEKVYLVLAEVRFDPKHPAARKEPTREAVMMVVREQDQWKLAHAPKLMRDWIRDKAGATGAAGEHP